MARAAEMILAIERSRSPEPVHFPICPSTPLHDFPEHYKTTSDNMVLKKLTKSETRKRTGLGALGRALQDGAKQRLVAMALVEALLCAWDCVLCLAFSTLSDLDPLGLLENLSAIRKMLDFWAYYVVGIVSLVMFWQGVTQRNREKTTLFLLWKIITTCLNGIGLLVFLSTLIYLEVKKNDNYDAHLTLLSGKSTFLGFEITAMTLVIISCAKTWIALCVCVAILIYIMKIRRAYCYNATPTTATPELPRLVPENPRSPPEKQSKISVTFLESWREERGGATAAEGPAKVSRAQSLANNFRASLKRLTTKRKRSPGGAAEAEEESDTEAPFIQPHVHDKSDSA